MNRTPKVAIKLSAITKRYTIHHEKPTLVEKFIHHTEEPFLALHDIFLTLYKGERLGIMGPNGSGKTTLLKIISRITTPTQGQIETKGRVVSLIDLDAGFHPDLNGEQNIFLNGMLLGMTKIEITEKMNRIIRFADIGSFIDTPLFTYSNGMILRLGFAIAVHADPDILILDEAMAVGDANFQKKCKTIIDHLIRKRVTLIVVSHIPQVLREYGTRYLILNKGEIYREGGGEVLSQYEKMNKSLI